MSTITPDLIDRLLRVQLAPSLAKIAGPDDEVAVPAPGAPGLGPMPGKNDPITPTPERRAQAVESAAAPVVGGLENVATGVNDVTDELDLAGIKPILDSGEYDTFDWNKHIPTTGVDKMTPQQLAQAQRKYLSLASNKTLTDRVPFMQARLFQNPLHPDDPKARLNFGAVGGVYDTRYNQFTPEEQAEYSKSLTPNMLEAGKLRIGSGAKVQTAFHGADKNLTEALKKVETDPDGTGFTDWMTSSWSNIAVPAGLLAMLFGGDTGMLLGGLAVAAGGYDLYNRYNTLTKDPAAQMAITDFMQGGFNKKSLEKIRTEYGDRYAKSALDFMAASRYGFLTVVRNSMADSAMNRMRSINPSVKEDEWKQYRQDALRTAPSADNSMQNDWSGKAWDTMKGWLPGTPAAAK